MGKGISVWTFSES